MFIFNSDIRALERNTRSRYSLFLSFPLSIYLCLSLSLFLLFSRRYSVRSHKHTKAKGNSCCSIANRCKYAFLKLIITKKIKIQMISNNRSKIHKHLLQNYVDIAGIAAYSIICIECRCSSHS